MIAISNINKKFGKLQVLNSVTLNFEKGLCIAMIGPNGCGKTTLIKCILGMVIPDSGEILFDGEPVRNRHTYRSRIGYMPQIGRYPENMTIGQVFSMIRDIRKPGLTVDEELIEKFNLPSMYGKTMRTLSGGTTQKVSAALAFLFNPDVLILDEPTAGLDPLASEILKEKIIAEKEKGKLILITSHLLSELDDLVTGIVFMQEGRIMLHETADNLRRTSGEQKLAKVIAGILKSQQS
jgi:Cu-processing system ATP-binding protein